MLSRLFIAALWSPAGKGLTSWLLLVMFIVFLFLSHVVSEGQVWFLIVSFSDLSLLSLLPSAQWLSGRVLDLRRWCCGLKPHRHHCFVSLTSDINPFLVLVRPRKTRPYITEKLLTKA